MKPKGLSVCMIVKNEESVLAQGLDSLRDIPDEIIIVDTGSTDSTRDIAQAYTHNVYDFEWIDDFSAARNYAQQFVSLSHTLSWDADFFLDKENYEKLIACKEAVLTHDLSLFIWNAEYIDGVGKKQELRSFVYDSDSFYWKYPIHNQLRRRDSDFVPQEYRRFDIEIHHLKDPQEKSHRYSQTHKILKDYVQNNPSDIRNLIFYASSCKHHKEYQEAIHIYKNVLRFLGHKDEYLICSLVEQYMVCLFSNSQEDEAWRVFEQYFALYPHNKILQLLYADKLYSHRQYQAALSWYERSYHNPLSMKDFQEPRYESQSSPWIPLIDRERYQVHPAYMLALMLSHEQQYNQAFEILHSVISLSTKSHVKDLYNWLADTLYTKNTS